MIEGQYRGHETQGAQHLVSGTGEEALQVWPHVQAANTSYVAKTDKYLLDCVRDDFSLRGRELMRRSLYAVPHRRNACEAACSCESGAITALATSSCARTRALGSEAKVRSISLRLFQGHALRSRFQDKAAAFILHARMLRNKLRNQM
jgi:hypothetical protein